MTNAILFIIWLIPSVLILRVYDLPPVFEPQSPLDLIPLFLIVLWGVVVLATGIGLWAAGVTV